jgi:hypothetical protein
MADMDAAVAHCTAGHRHLGLGRQRRGRPRARRGDGLLRRRAHAGDAGRRLAAARAPARPAHPRRQRRRPDEAAAAEEHPHGLATRLRRLFTTDKPVIFAFHGYPWLIHRLTYRRTNHANIHVRGYKERGNINTPLELAILNQTDRFTLVMDVIDRVPGLAVRAAHLKQMKNEIILNLAYGAWHRSGAHHRLGVALLNEASSVGGCSPSHLIPLNGERFPESYNVPAN